jgi:hypothetical protein
MQNMIRAIVREGKIEALELVDVPDGTELLVTILSEENDFWLGASQPALDKIWDNTEDDVYAELLER